MTRLLPIFLFLWASLALAQEIAIPSWATTMMYWETLNSYKPQTEVNEKFQPGSRQVFGIKSMDIPVEELHVVDSGAGGDLIRSQIEFEKNGKKYFRFFVHPESEHLYEKLLKKYGAKELYWAAATASTRSLLAWPKDSKDGEPLFLKLSLAKQQDDLGRIIPDWEVRRSVGITELVQTTPHEKWMNSGASIIPEIMGAYVDKKENLGFYVDSNQGKVKQHGLIVRDAAFLKEAQAKGWEVRPLFSLFTAQEGNKPPLIIEKWKESGKPFVEFVEDYLYKPFIEKNAYLFFEEHIVPEIHGQNVLVAVDPETKEIKHFYHRDVGSMKVDLRMRWLHGKSVEPLRTPNAAYDFKFERATSAVEDVYGQYLNEWLFRWGYKDEIQKHVEGFEPEQTLKSLKALLRADVAKRFPLKKDAGTSLAVTERLEQYIQEHAPALEILEGKPASTAKMAAFLRVQKKNNQRIELPDSWIEAWKLKSGAKVITSQGVVVVGRIGAKSYLYFHRKRLPEVIKMPKVAVMKKNGLRVGFFSGTFDPPHSGHKATIQNALKELDLDLIYVLPSPSPDHKPKALPFEIRKEMSMAYFSDDPRIKVADDDIVKVAREEGIGGLQRYIAKRHAKDQVFQVMGDDAFQRLLEDSSITYPKNFTVVVGDRGDGLHVPEKTAGGNKVIALEAKGEKGLSSTKMREQIAAGIKPAEISDEVYAIAVREHAYGAKAVPCIEKFAGLKQSPPKGK